MQSRQASDAHGIDVSHWQGAIQWPQVARAGIRFAYIKATESGTYVDPAYVQNAKGADLAGIVRGAYHFARPADGYSAKAQAEHFLRTARVDGTIGLLPPALDLEVNGRLSKAGLADWVRTFDAEVKKQVGRNIVVYVSPGFAQQYLDTSLTDLMLWVADWGTGAPSNFGHWTHWTFWQYTNRGHVPGINGDVDLNAYAGSPAQLRHAFATEGGQLKTGVGSQSPVSRNPSGSATTLSTLRSGSRGQTVKQLQLQLYRVGKHAGPVDGNFGPSTLAAVLAFQKQRGLTADGIVGTSTWNKLHTAPMGTRPMLSSPVQGQQVKDAQYLLTYRGAHPGGVDGVFGPQTRAATERFQRVSHLAVDGVIGPATWSLLTH